MTIIRYPAPVLRQVARPIEQVDQTVRAVAERMIELMHAAPGIGLAAPQVGLAWRMFVAHVPRGEREAGEPATSLDEPRVYVNPVISDPAGGVEAWEEGCLSLPDIHGDVLRPPEVTITALGLDGETFSQRGAGLLARCWQHEVDHLDGVLIIDRMIRMHKLKNRSAIKAMERAR